MNRFFTLLAVVALAAVATQAQRPIRISAVAGDNMMMLPYTSGGLSTQQAAGVLPNETMPEGPYRMSPLEQIYIQNDQLGPLTDSSIYIKSVDGSGDSAHIGWRYPSAIGDQSGNILYQQTGLGQVFTSLPGTFRIDSLIMLIYSTDAPPNFSKLNSPLRWIPFYVSTNVRSSTYRGLREAFDNLEFLNSDYEEISASTVAGQVQGNSVRAFTMNFSNPINIDKNRHFGFIFRKTDNDPGNFFMLGQYEWALTRNQCLGVSIDRHKANDPSSDTLKTLAHNIVISMNDRVKYANFQQKEAKYNFRMFLFGLYDGPPLSVETLSDEAAPFTLNTITPNPVNDGTKFMFSLQSSSTVSLRVVNAMGQVVATEIDNATMSAGSYSADFNASALPSGTYFVTLSNGTQSVTRSMVVVR